MFAHLLFRVLNGFLTDHLIQTVIILKSNDFVFVLICGNRIRKSLRRSSDSIF